MRTVPRWSRVLAIAASAALAGSLLTVTVLGASIQKNGKAVGAVRTATAADPVYAPTESFANLPGSSLAVGVPSGQQGLLLVTFSAVSQCGGPGGGFCYVRVLVDGEAAEPGAVVFDSADDGPGGSVNSYETNSMQFIAGPLSAGRHTVRVQYWAANGASFFVSARTLTVLRAAA